MSDTLEPRSLRRILTTPLLSSRLRDTPLRDLVRLRLTDRLNWRGRLASASLPAPVADLIKRIIRRSRLWRLEKAAVADELIAHFRDGIESGARAETLVYDFGDERLAARLIRRAKQRNRSIVWQAFKWSRRLLAILVALYAIAFVRFMLGRPRVSVDYVAQLNTAAEAVPPTDRAWPIYREAMRALSPVYQTLWAFYRDDDQKDDSSLSDHYLIDSTPDDAEWSRLVTILDDKAAAIAQVRRAAAKPTLGFVVDEDNRPDETAEGLGLLMDGSDSLFAQALANARGPAQGELNTFVHLLHADSRLAVTRRDPARVAADLNAMLDIARQLRGPMVSEQNTSIFVYHYVLEAISSTLARSPAALTDAQLVALAHHVSSIGGETASSLLDLSGEKLRFRDLVQRAYTDDGNGDGRLTQLASDPRMFAILFGQDRSQPENIGDRTCRLLATSAFALVSSRRDVLAEFDRLADEQMEHITHPLRDFPADEAWPSEQRVRAYQDNPVRSARYAPVALATPWIDIDYSAQRAEQLLGQRDGVLAGIGLELYRRRTGAYPVTLNELTPTLLPQLPVDRFSGGEVKYRLIGGAPVVYSVGADGKDDAGRASANWRDRTHSPSPDAAAERRFGQINWPLPDGDWILYDARPELTTRPATSVP